MNDDKKLVFYEFVKDGDEVWIPSNPWNLHEFDEENGRRLIFVVSRADL